ncbi:MAG: DUF1207 domain-containing protein [Tenuifilaceae bacterium]
MKRLLLLVILILDFVIYSEAQTDSSIVFLPKTRIFPVIFNDPLECQINGGTYLLNRKGSDLSLYNQVNIGFTKPIVAKHLKSISWEINFGAATFTQFDLIKKETGTYLAGLLNNDYKISLDFSIQKTNNLLRFNAFHVSSHLGDDYMLRHNDSLPNDKSVNYEQLDLTYLRLKGENYWYAGLGEIYTKYVFRERFSLHGGGYIRFGNPKPLNLFASINLKVFAENSFNPDIRSAFGLSINRKSEPLIRIWLEYYSGQLPYSTLDYGRVNWIGLAMWINVF